MNDFDENDRVRKVVKERKRGYHFLSVYFGSMGSTGGTGSIGRQKRLKIHRFRVH